MLVVQLQKIFCFYGINYKKILEKPIFYQYNLLEKPIKMHIILLEKHIKRGVNYV